MGSQDYYAMKNEPCSPKDNCGHLVEFQAAEGERIQAEALERERLAQVATSSLPRQSPAMYDTLPDKIKRAIWEQANRDAPGRIIALQYPEIKPPAKQSSLKRIFHPFTSSKPKHKIVQHRFVSPAPHAATYHVNKLSREITLKYSQRLFSEHDRHDYITADLSRDTIILPALQYSIAEIAARYQVAVSSDQKYRLRYLVFETPVEIGTFQSMPERPMVETSAIKQLYLSLSTCLEMILLVGGKGKAGSILEEAARVAKIELKDFEGVAIPGEADVATLEVERDVYRQVKYHRMDVKVRYMHQRQGGKRVSFEIPFTLFYRDMGETLRVWDTEKERYDVEVIDVEHGCRAYAWVESVAMHMATVANEAARQR